MVRNAEKFIGDGYYWIEIDGKPFLEVQYVWRVGREIRVASDLEWKCSIIEGPIFPPVRRSLAPNR